MNSQLYTAAIKAHATEKNLYFCTNDIIFPFFNTWVVGKWNNFCLDNTSMHINITILIHLHACRHLATRWLVDKHTHWKTHTAFL